jgi:hypothetical protein
MKTVLYLLSSALVLASGIIVLQHYSTSQIGQSVATSLISGGIASFAFSIIRYFDDRDNRQASLAQLDKTSSIDASIGSLEGAVNRLQSLTLVSHDAELRCIFDRHCTKQFSAAMESYTTTTLLKIDVMGFSLNRFYSEQWQRLEQRGNVYVRILIQDPLSPTFAWLAKQESRDIQVMMKDAVELSRSIMNKVSSCATERNVKLDIRWFSGIPSVTLSRVNDAIFVRARMLNEGKDAPVFFEHYTIRDGRCFATYSEYFDNAWNVARAPAIDEISAGTSGIV